MILVANSWVIVGYKYNNTSSMTVDSVKTPIHTPS